MQLLLHYKVGPTFDQSMLSARGIGFEIETEGTNNLNQNYASFKIIFLQEIQHHYREYHLFYLDLPPQYTKLWKTFFIPDSQDL